jgi:hypothetical protein
MCVVPTVSVTLSLPRTTGEDQISASAQRSENEFTKTIRADAGKRRRPIRMASKKELQSRIDMLDSVFEILQELRAALVSELKTLTES